MIIVIQCNDQLGLVATISSVLQVSTCRDILSGLCQLSVRTWHYYEGKKQDKKAFNHSKIFLFSNNVIS